MGKFDWKKAKYPCFGITKQKDIVCFSKYGVGHLAVKNSDWHKLGEYADNWGMACFEPYEQSKEKAKLWYWEVKTALGWALCSSRYSEKEASELLTSESRKLESLGYIEE